MVVQRVQQVKAIGSQSVSARVAIAQEAIEGQDVTAQPMRFEGLQGVGRARGTHRASGAISGGDASLPDAEADLRRRAEQTPARAVPLGAQHAGGIGLCEGQGDEERHRRG